jgi:hypothetical protein
LNQFSNYHIKIESDKCEISKPELTYLGHVIVAEAVRLDLKKIEVVVRFPNS